MSSSALTFSSENERREPSVAENGLETPQALPCAADARSSCDFSGAAVAEQRDPKIGLSRVYRCSKCGHGITRPAVPDASVLYEDRDTQDYQGQDSALASALKLFAFKRQTRRMLKQAGFRGGKIVDFGCGSGVYTEAIARSGGSSAQVVGLDFFDSAPPGIRHASYTSFDDKAQLDGTADLVTCFHVLEHDDDPQAILGQLEKLARSGGTIVIEVPHIDCPWRHVFGSQWDNWYLPFHRTHFSRASLRAAIERAGLHIEAEHDIHIPAIGRSLANLLGMSNSLPFVLISALAMPIQAAVEKITRGPSALRVVARKV